MFRFYRVLWLLSTIVLIGLGNLVSAANNTPGSFGTDFVFAVPSVSLSQSWGLMKIYCNPVSTNASMLNRTCDKESIGQLGGVGKNLSSKELGSKIPGPRILDAGMEKTFPDLEGVQSQIIASSPWIGEGTLIYPVDTLGKNYITNGVNQQSCSVTATRDSTTVNLIFPNGTSASFQLNRLQALFFSVDTSTFGTKIKADQPVSVSMGNGCEDEESDTKCAYLWEQAVPVENFGTDYMFIDPNLGTTGSYPTKICLVNGGNNVVKVNISGITDGSPILLTPGRKVQVYANDLMHHIKADGPIDVQALSSSLYGYHSQIGLIPSHQFVKQACTNGQGGDSYLILVALTEDVMNPESSLIVYGESFDLRSFMPTVDSSYSYTHINSSNTFGYIYSSFGFAGYDIVLSRNSPSSKDPGVYGSAVARNVIRMTK